MEKNLESFRLIYMRDVKTSKQISVNMLSDNIQRRKNKNKNTA